MTPIVIKLTFLGNSWAWLVTSYPHSVTYIIVLFTEKCKQSFSSSVTPYSAIRSFVFLPYDHFCYSYVNLLKSCHHYPIHWRSTCSHQPKTVIIYTRNIHRTRQANFLKHMSLLILRKSFTNSCSSSCLPIQQLRLGCDA